MSAGVFSRQSSSIGYRSDIDGLRGISVAAIVLFHAGFLPFRGGFVGVDVFFVISGYLITLISLKEAENGNFSILKFYEKRARRILPALLLVCLVCTFYAGGFINPVHSITFFESLLAALTFTSNFLFWSQSGYFDVSSEIKPLLHTWSLSVEEQYYILFPLCLLALMRLKSRIAATVISLALLASLVAAQVLISSGHKPAAFFLLPARAWEILSGVCCALATRSAMPDWLPEKLRSILALAGLGIVCICMPVFNDNTITPGPHAIIPVTGTALILLFSREGTLAHRLLSMKPLVLLGLISFSAYLWHQPVFAFFRLAFGSALTAPWMAALCLALLPLSFASYRLVEVPFRNRSLIPAPRFVKMSVITTSALIAISVGGVATYGYVNIRFPVETAHMFRVVIDSTQYDTLKNMAGDGACNFHLFDLSDQERARFKDCADKHGKAVIVIGDSHAQNLYNVLAKTGEYKFLAGLARSGARANKSDHGNWFHKDLLTFLNDNKNSVSQIIYHQISLGVADADEKHAPSDFGNTKQIQKNIGKLLSYLDMLSQFGDAIWLGSFPDYGHNPAYAVLDPSTWQMSAGGEHRVETVDKMLAVVPQEFRVTYVPFKALYEMPDSPFLDDCVLFKDTDHLSLCGEDVVAEYIAENDKLKALEAGGAVSRPAAASGGPDT